jgi:hypothetical protein
MTAGIVAADVLVVIAAPDNAGLDRVLRDLVARYERLSARGIGDPFLAIALEVPSLWTGPSATSGSSDTPSPCS